MTATSARSSGAGAASRRFGIAGLPDFPWDSLADAKASAQAHPDGIVDLSVGTPVDPTPEVVRQALVAAADAPGYPTTTGPESLRTAIADHLTRTAGAVPLPPDAVLPTIGSKELVAALPAQLGLGAGDVVVLPELAYPTYAVGAQLAGADPVATDRPQDLPVAVRDRVALVWVNSPANPSGRILPADELAALVRWARDNDALLVSDECYLPFAWDAPAVSVLDPQVNGGSTDHVLAVHSMSKRSNLAGYRAAFAAGDPAVVDALLAVRKHAGFMVPTPVQKALEAAVADDEHVAQQRARYAARRDLLGPALRAAGFTIDHSEGSLYLWSTLGEPSADTVRRLAGLGILVAPGTFYGDAGGRHVRVALTATDERLQQAATRLEARPLTEVD